MKIIILLLSIINGSYMLVDGIYCLIKGKYIGPEKPGPWANLFYKFKIDVFKLSPLFILYGMVWFLFIFTLWTNQSYAFPFGIIISLATLWYLPIGTLLSLMILVILLASKQIFLL